MFTEICYNYATKCMKDKEHYKEAVDFFIAAFNSKQSLPQKKRNTVIEKNIIYAFKIFSSIHRTSAYFRA